MPLYKIYSLRSVALTFATYISCLYVASMKFDVYGKHAYMHANYTHFVKDIVQLFHSINFNQTSMKYTSIVVQELQEFSTYVLQIIFKLFTPFTNHILFKTETN